ncbi:exodeoxyribonuclease VII large subunit [Patescibacteria group bacterium]|nr:MAG: exodeoxyribonuclease VII large subunit [Patescibacteria group bacterium]
MQLLEPPSDQIIGVKAFLDILNETLNFAFPAVTIEGEVSSYKVNQGKWVFFDLKDEDATLPCFIPIYQLKVPIEDGMKIRVTGVPKVTKWGKFSLTVKSVSLAGEGALKRAFELLKAKLQQEGLFEASRKRALPRFPERLGLVTSGQSAAYADFIKILGQRWGGMEIQLADVQVQGQPAPAQIVRAIEYFNQQASVPDVLVVIRGGGSLEDLQAFNTEEVARAIAGSRVPTLVGVGHEVDVSLADFAADVRAATPTDAARIVVPDKAEVIQDIGHRQRRFEQTIRGRLDRYQNHIIRQINVLERFVRLPQARLQNLELRLLNAQRQTLAMQQQRLNSLSRLLGSYDPTATLKRGYAIVRKGEQVVTGPQQVNVGDSLVVQLAAGNINAKVDK